MLKIGWIEKVRFVLVDCVLIGVISYLFYENILAYLILLPILPILYKHQKKEFIRKKKNKIMNEFKDLCNVLSNNLLVGYSFENALNNSIKETKELYGNKSYLSKELKIVINKININIPVEKAFMEFAIRTEVEEIIIFAEILKISKRSSGNIVEIIRDTVDSITDRIELKREIEVIFAAKKFEQKIMNVIPFFIICYVKFTSPDMLDVMYETLLGQILMTVFLLVFIVALILSEKIINMEDYV
ncbi:MAG: type II secretion system F family protein [Lachnospiraceae bacterium]|nr:type II secretion system F family protein [Lachnospiraceae bacterium]